MVDSPQTFLRTHDYVVSTLGVSAVAQKWNPFKGKWTLSKLVKREIEHNGGEMPVEDLLQKMRHRGYLKGALLDGLEALDVVVINGMARMRY